MNSFGYSTWLVLVELARRLPNWDMVKQAGRDLKTLAFIVLLALGACAPAYGSGIAVMMSKDVDPLREALEGFKDTAHFPIAKQYNINGDLNRGRKDLEEIQSAVKPGLLFTLGGPALQVATGKRADLAGVYSMVFNPSSILGKDVKNFTGVSMSVPVGEVLESLKELIPPVRRLGVLFNPASSQATILEITLAARKRGVQLVDAGVNARSQLPQALESLREKIDALWILPDPTILASGVVDYIVLWSYRNKIPVVGQAQEHTKKGALLSFSSGSNRDMGRQAGELASRILRGEKLAVIRHVVSRPATLTLNPKTAEKLGVEIPDRLVKRAANLIQAPVYEEGDWWVFRVKRRGRPPETYRVAYENGNFESDYPDFLAVSRDPYSISWLPLISVDLAGPKKQWFKFPLFAGKEWEFTYKHSVRDQWGSRRFSGNLRVSRFVRSRVVRESRRILTAAGTYVAIEISRNVDFSGGQYRLTYFYSPESKSVVKLHGTGSIGDDDFDYDMELVGYGRAAPRPTFEPPLDLQTSTQVHKPEAKIDWSKVQAPVYREGDWWVFQVRKGERQKEYLVTYMNGQFMASDPEFLSVSKDPTADYFYPLISVNVADPRFRSFQFPLVPGHQWQFRYKHGRIAMGGSPSSPVQWRTVHTTVLGKTREPVKTPAGTFETVELRQNVASGASDVWFSYFYSPETKSVVRFKAARTISPIVHAPRKSSWEMQLLAYGDRTSLPRSPVAASVRGNSTDPVETTRKGAGK